MGAAMSAAMGPKFQGQPMAPSSSAPVVRLANLAAARSMGPTPPHAAPPPHLLQPAAHPSAHLLQPAAHASVSGTSRPSPPSFFAVGGMSRGQPIGAHHPAPPAPSMLPTPGPPPPRPPLPPPGASAPSISGQESEKVDNQLGLVKALTPAALQTFVPKLAELGVECAADLRYVTDKDLELMDMTLIQKRKFKEAAHAAEPGDGASASGARREGKGASGSTGKGDSRGSRRSPPRRRSRSRSRRDRRRSRSRSRSRRDRRR